MNEQDRRIYQRGSHFYTIAKISTDEKNWKEVEISDLSSGGLQLHTDVQYEKGDMLWFHLKIQGFFSQFEIKARGTIRRIQQFDGDYVYGIAFAGLKQDLEVLIDENVKNDRPIAGTPYNYD